VTGICAYGFYRVGKGNLERRYETITGERGDLGSGGRGTWPLITPLTTKRGS
jgi:hypothetical protein